MIITESETAENIPGDYDLLTDEPEMLDYFDWARKAHRLANLTFDLSVFDIFGIFDAGGTLVMPEPEREKDPLRWLELLEQQQITIWNTVPMLMEML
ncbi:hypothetical protein ADUPG1_001904, partial [Aduncisulcus paluster]